MGKRVILLDSDEKQCQGLCVMLTEKGYRTIPMDSILHLQKYLQTRTCLALIIDLDTIPVDNRAIRELSIKNPGVYILGLSKDRFHPELKDAICYHVYACINKPVDPDELFYWLRTIYEDELDPDCQSEA